MTPRTYIVEHRYGETYEVLAFDSADAILAAFAHKGWSGRMIVNVKRAA